MDEVLGTSIARPPVRAGTLTIPHWTEIDWGARTHRMQIDGRWVNYVELGEPGRPALVFIHGIMGRWANWLENLPTFARDHHVIALDLPGFGESELPNGEITIAGYADVVRKLCEALGVTRATLVGNSMGGLTAGIAAQRHADFVERLVLVDPAGFATAQGLIHRARWILHAFDGPLRLLYRVRRLLTKTALMRAIAIGGWLTPHPIRMGSAMAAELVEGIGRTGFRPALASILSEKVAAAPIAIHCPALVIWGRWDMVIPKSDAHRWANICANSETMIFKRSGHLPMVDEAGEFNTALATFLRANPAGLAPAPPEAEYAA